MIAGGSERDLTAIYCIFMMTKTCRFRLWQSIAELISSLMPAQA